jgi:hypothetical protein
MKKVKNPFDAKVTNWTDHSRLEQTSNYVQGKLQAEKITIIPIPYLHIFY